MTRYLMTHSLLSSWLYAMKDSPYEDATTERDPYDEFMKTLRREPTETTKVMQNGIDFENLVTKIVCGQASQIRRTETQDGQQRLLDAKPLTEDPWYDAANQIAGIIKGAQLQYRAQTVLHLADMTLLLYGRLDALKAGDVYDIKFSTKYEGGSTFIVRSTPCTWN